MKTKDVMAYLFMALVLVSFLSIAQLLTDMRDQSAALAKEIKCASVRGTIGCDESVDISAGDKDGERLLTIK